MSQNNLVVKEVDFFGDTLKAARDEKGIVWAGVNYFCHGIGLNKNERDRQVKNVQADEVLKRGCVKFDAGVFDPNNETLGFQLEYIPLWLAKISITPAMKENAPELVEKLVNYQLKAKDVLAAAFLPQRKPVRRIGKNKTKISLYEGEKSHILMVGDEMYELEVDKFEELNSFVPEMEFMEVSQISRVVMAYLSVHKDSAPKLSKQWDIECEG